MRGNVGRRSRVAVALAMLVTACLGCVTTPLEEFGQSALPVLERRCLTPVCHGVAPGEAMPSVGLFVQLDGQAHAAELDAARLAFRARVVTTEPAALSTLLRRPMPTWAGGGPHAGGALFTGPDDPAVADIARWIAAEPLGSGGEDLQLDSLELEFAEKVLPTLVARCGRSGCHGPRDVAFTAIPATPDPATGRFAPLEVRAANDVLRKMLDLWSDDPARSRLVRKAIGAEAGGLVHRGGEGTFFPEAPVAQPLDVEGIAAMLLWAEHEREMLDVVAGRAPAGLVFVRGPIAERAPWRIEREAEGSDVWLAPWPVGGGAEENLSAAVHPDGLAEVREPAVSHDARRIAFAMRRAGELNFAIWELELATRAARRVSPEGAGGFAAPTYAPDGRIVAAWDGHGEVGTDGEGVPPELVAIDAYGALERLTFTPVPEMRPAIFASGKTRGELAFSVRREQLGPRGPLGLEGVLFRFPLCHDPAHHGEPEYHAHFGASLAPRVPYAPRDLPDGRQALVVLDDARTTDDRGALAVLDRSLGPVVPNARSGDASVGGYRPALRVVDDARRWRDPAALPDGRIVAAIDDPSRPGDDAIVAVTLRDAIDGPHLESFEVLVDAPGLSDRSPVALIARAPEDDGHTPIVDPSAPTGTLVLRNVAVLEMLYGRAPPLGARSLRDDLAAIRVLAWGGARADSFARHAEGGTTVGLSAQPPARLLAEVPLASDGSAFVRIPARTPVLLQWLDSRGMVRGNQLDRWYFAQGEERVPGGTNAPTYSHDCAGCHGAFSGRPADAQGPAPDVISAASVTLSTFAARDRRRPLAPFDASAPPSDIDYRTTIAPLFERTCTAAGCHSGDAPAIGLPLDARAGTQFSAAYEALLVRDAATGEGRYVDLDGLRARRSALAEHLVGAELEAPRPLGPACPARSASDDDVRSVARWIESGAVYDANATEPHE